MPDSPLLAHNGLHLPKKGKTKRGRSQKPKEKLASEESGLMATDIKIEGYSEIYLRRATGKLFGEIGCVPVSLVSHIVSDQDFDPATLGSE